MRNGDHLSERLWAYDDYTEFEDRPADSGTVLTSLGFFRAALRRRRRVWRALAIAGLVIGVGLGIRLPVVYQASTSLLITPMSQGGEAAGAAISNEQAIAQSLTVAQLVIKQLGLRESAGSLVHSYTVTPTTDRVLVITVKARSSADAVTRADAVANQYLKFRAQLALREQTLLFTSLDDQIKQDTRQLNSITAQISQASAKAPSPEKQSDLANLKRQKTEAESALTSLQGSVATAISSSQQATDLIISSSRQLDPAAPSPPHSLKKRALEYGGLGLLGGLVLGMGGIVIGALLSDRLRRRDDVAHALGAPVKLSVGPLRPSRTAGLAATRNASVERIAAYLSKTVPPPRRGPASLAVVCVDEIHVPAACLVALAISRAEHGARVLVADLCEGAPAAGLLGVHEPGVRTVTVEGSRLTVAVPEPSDVTPLGPLQNRPGQPRSAESLAAACASADVVLTLASLDPSIGGDHLGGWARSAVVLVTAGKSSAARIHAVGEMVRLAGTSVISGVLIGADKADESLGVTLPPDGDRGSVGKDGLSPRVEDFFVAGEGPSGRPTP